MQENGSNPYYEKAPSTGKGLFFGGMVIGMLVTALLASTVFLCVRVYGYMAEKKQTSEQIAQQETTPDKIVDAQLMTKLSNLEQIIDIYYYQDDVDAAALENGIYKGLLDAVGDPYTVYYTEEEIQELMEQTQGIYYGIGCYVGLDETTNCTKVVNAIPGTPAEEAGLRADDIIYEVDGVSTYDMDLNSVVALIKGEEGTKVSLTIYRQGEPDYLYIDVERRKVESPTVEYEMLEDGMAYIQITEFDDVTVDQFADALATVKESDMEGLIIDLRANPGGSLDAVVEIAGMLLPEGLIVYTEDKYGERAEYTCDGMRAFEYPLVVLVDGNSASASEILAGAVQDYGMGKLVGTTTFGKGIVQRVVNLSDGSAVKITVSSYYTPNGRNIQGIGIEPDVECKFDGEAYYGEEKFDNQLDKAKQILAELIAEEK